MSPRRDDVVIVDFPFSDRTGSKVRPALVVQADALNGRIADTIIALISSTHRTSPTQLLIDISTPEGRLSGLRQNSSVQCQKNLLTIDQQLILRVIGRLPAATMAKVDDCLKAALGLP
jgi:mRNA interferase MazF